ncbi:MAG: ribosome biogenesis GTP-binding protein YihA/YsxC [Clostridia bacterium]|nr:ribosome biogenesis GTP-binding protein YihA/YsxC [Clostridia bacterium]
MNFNNVTYLASYGTSSQLPESEMPEIVFSGRSNVGKSSLINKLFNRKNLARISSTPGKTITINFFKGNNAIFVDLPGYGYAKRERLVTDRWAELMEGYFKSGRNIVLVIQLIDVRHTPTADDLNMLSFLYQMGIPFIIVFTKCDKLNKTETINRMSQIENEISGYPEINKIFFSSVTGQGTDEIRNQIIKSIGVL